MSKNFFVLFLLAFSLAIVSTQFSASSFAVFGSSFLLQVVTNSTSTNFVTVTATTTTQATLTLTVSTNSSTTSVNTVLTSTTITFPSIVMSTTVISNTQTNIISLTITTTQTTNALALVWGGTDYSTLFWIALFAVICLIAVVVFHLAGKGEKRNGIERNISGPRRQ